MDLYGATGCQYGQDLKESGRPQTEHSRGDHWEDDRGCHQSTPLPQGRAAHHTQRYMQAVLLSGLVCTGTCRQYFLVALCVQVHAGSTS